MCLFTIPAFFIRLDWIKSGAWVSIAVIAWVTWYFDRRVSGERAALGPMSVEPGTPIKECWPTDVSAVFSMFVAFFSLYFSFA
jgi:hypothetical protein